MVSPISRALGRWVPTSLVTIRLALGLLMAPAATRGWPRWWYATALPLGVLSDIFDGVIARRLGATTSLLRRCDSAVDIVFYAGVLWAMCVLHPQLAWQYRWGIGTLVGLEVFINLLSLIRFRRPPATHCWLAKAWGLLLFANFWLLLGFGISGPLMQVTVVGGCFVYAEVIAILLLLDRPAVDVRSVWHAWKSRRQPGADVERV